MKYEHTTKAIHLLGKSVKVIMDRPMNSLHSKHGFRYEINYGYIPNTMAEDGDEIDAYVLGIDRPLDEFEGVVKAIILRKDDVEDKLVVTTSNYTLTKQEVIEKTHFQEQFFDIEVLIIKNNNDGNH